MERKEKHTKQIRKLNETLFKSKLQARKLWAKEPIEMKIQELLKMQEITKTLYPKYARILPWRIKTD